MSSKIIDSALAQIRVVRCPICHQRRRCQVVEYDDFTFWSCSKDHMWEKKVPKTLLKEIFHAPKA